LKLRKQTPAKALVAGLTAGLMVALFFIIRSEPRAKAAPNPTPERPVDYQRFFAPNATPSANPPAAAPARPHTRTQAS